MRRIILAAAILPILAVVPARLRAQSSAASSSKISLDDRVLMASRIYRIVSAFFPGLSQEKFDAAYAAYMRTILGTPDRREFDLLSMEFVADLHDGHSWFYDTWLDQTYAQPIGFLAYPLAGKRLNIGTSG